MMKKLALLVMTVFLIGCMCISALGTSPAEPIVLGDTMVVTVPKPEGEINPGIVYFQKEFLFIPEESGTYRFLMDYQDDPEQPYDVFLDLPGAYQQLDNGIEFEAVAGEQYLLNFQYPNHDGRYPQITFFLGTPDMEFNPKTDDLLFLLPMFCLVLSIGILVTFRNSYRTE